LKVRQIPAHVAIKLFSSIAYRQAIGKHAAMSLYTKAADLVHRGAVVGLFSFFCFQAYQIGSNTRQGVVDSPHLKSTYFKEVNETVAKEYAKDNEKREDWYQTDDDSYLKGQVRPNTTLPEFKKRYDQHK
jgi:hypothetical protein